MHPAKNFNRVDFPLSAVPTIAVMDPTGRSTLMGCNIGCRTLPPSPKTQYPRLLRRPCFDLTETSHFSMIARPGLITVFKVFLRKYAPESRLFFLSPSMTLNLLAVEETDGAAECAEEPVKTLLFCNPVSMTPMSPTALAMRSWFTLSGFVLVGCVVSIFIWSLMYFKKDAMVREIKVDWHRTLNSIGESIFRILRCMLLYLC
mmetsp:Transcript_15702/g.32630  ORF Transcript_15702/g.32630 Transcript_15702/m.32630 type:complete len:203 (-) Transcript_15702:14-622(-)